MRYLVLYTLCLFSLTVNGQVVDEPNGSAYHYVKSYRIELAVPPAEVWPHVMNLGGWMYDFKMMTIEGNPGQVGSVVRLYEDQEFKMLLTAVEPERLLIMANLPITDRGETGTGIGIVQLTQVGDGTEVSLVMNRRYDWRGTRENVLRTTRLSPEFNESTDALWTRFLNRLKTLAEGS